MTAAIDDPLNSTDVTRWDRETFASSVTSCPSTRPLTLGETRTAPSGELHDYIYDPVRQVTVDSDDLPVAGKKCKPRVVVMPDPINQGTCYDFTRDEAERLGQVLREVATSTVIPVHVGVLTTDDTSCAGVAVGRPTAISRPVVMGVQDARLFLDYLRLAVDECEIATQLAGARNSALEQIRACDVADDAATRDRAIVRAIRAGVRVGDIVSVAGTARRDCMGDLARPGQ